MLTIENILCSKRVPLYAKPSILDAYERRLQGYVDSNYVRPSKYKINNPNALKALAVDDIMKKDYPYIFVYGCKN